MTFNSESDVRAWLKERCAEVWWIENKRGGTPGFPDAVVVPRFGLPRPVFVELKLAEMVEEGHLVVEAAPAQRNVLVALEQASLGSGIAAGIAGTSRVIWAEPKSLVRFGTSKRIGGRKLYRIAEWFQITADRKTSGVLI